MDDFAKRVSEDSGDYPESWKPGVGDQLIGVVKAYGTYTGDYGEVPTVTITDGNAKDHGVFISGYVIKDQFQAKRPKIGERIGLKRVADGNSKRSGQTYKRFVLHVDRAGGDMPNIDHAPDGDLPDLEAMQRAAKALESVTVQDEGDDDGLPF